MIITKGIRKVQRKEVIGSIIWTAVREGINL